MSDEPRSDAEGKVQVKVQVAQKRKRTATKVHVSVAPKQILQKKCTKRTVTVDSDDNSESGEEEGMCNPEEGDRDEVDAYMCLQEQQETDWPVSWACDSPVSA